MVQNESSVLAIFKEETSVHESVKKLISFVTNRARSHFSIEIRIIMVTQPTLLFSFVKAMPNSFLTARTLLLRDSGVENVAE